MRQGELKETQIKALMDLEQKLIQSKEQKQATETSLTTHPEFLLLSARKVQRRRNSGCKVKSSQSQIQKGVLEHSP